MKKYFSLLLVAVMAVSLFAGCSTNKNDVTDAATEPATEAVAMDPVEMLNTVWNGYTANAPEDLQFPVCSGVTDDGDMIEGAGKVDLSTPDTFGNILNVPAELHAQIDDAAYMMHMMNANTFTAGVYHVVKGTDMKAFVDTLTEGIKGTQWICGFPGWLTVITYGEDVFAYYGDDQLVSLIKDETVKAFPEAEIATDISLAN